VLATSTSSVSSYRRQDSVDFRMGLLMAAGGVVGAGMGVEIFRILRLMGQIDMMISVIYLVFLCGIGGLMARESLASLLRRKKGLAPVRPKLKRPPWLYALPF